MNQHRPKISIIMSVYNTAQYLRQSIESIIKQTYTDWELIVIDDGSTDGSAAICDEMATKDVRIQVKHKNNSGQADSRNLALTMAQGEFIGFVDSDDWIEPGMYECLLKHQEKHNADAVMCRYYEEYTDESVPQGLDEQLIGCFNNQEIIRIIYSEIINVLWTCLMRRELIQEKIPAHRYMEDNAVLIKWFSHSQRTVICSDKLYHYRMRKGSVMHINKRLDRELTNLRVTQERSLFVQQLNVLPHQEVVLREAKEYLHIAQDFVRANRNNQECMTLVSSATTLLKSITHLDLRSQRLKIRNRLVLLRNTPKGFIRFIRFSGLFSFHRKRIHIERLYE